MMGADGLTSATEHALLAANYVAARLGAAYPVLYAGPRTGASPTSASSTCGRSPRRAA